ncbi:8-oxo-dGTP diphosphatase [Pullulanibacillus pueri]|uniref:DNA mismatch repair protein MutT n=1 Tax=Pullulanibacillus pueri TaxID=1437324 RepID=A0A8J3ESL0_9BACL|nr:NUDIX hydrolase [Pullulanibacillus pueri]MBM7684171.1 8-oxo-dGTP diphosphatase [Pullulanibacillus pueri]GGH88829.1 DNA mismatch repair protein MutT [Pullulanibacillus pueri]
MIRVDVAYAIILDEKQEKILMVENNRGNHNEWSLPGGEREKGETLEEAVTREVQEETGLAVEVGDVFSVNETFLDEQTHALFITMWANITGGTQEIQRPEEILAIEWKSLEEADRLMPYFPNGISALIQKHSNAVYHFESKV